MLKKSKQNWLVIGILIFSLMPMAGCSEKSAVVNNKPAQVIEKSQSSADLTGLTRNIPVNQSAAIPNGTLFIEELVLVPTQTVVKLRYKGEEHAPDLTAPGVKLKTPDGLAEPRGGGSHGTTRVGDTWEQTYDLEFQRLDPVPQEVTLELAGLVYQRGETQVPLSDNQAALAPDGRKVQIKALQQKGRTGEATLYYVTDGKNPWPFSSAEWQVLDDHGKLYRTNLPEIKSSVSFAVGKQPAITGDATQKEYALKLSWELPPGIKAAALVNAGYWEYRDNLGSFTIQTPEGCY